jgi:hypothetical protein
VIELIDFPAFMVGSSLMIVGIIQIFRQWEAQEAWDREGPDAKRYRRKDNPKAYWSIIAMYAVMAVLGFSILLYSLWGLQP